MFKYLTSRHVTILLPSPRTSLKMKPVILGILSLLLVNSATGDSTAGDSTAGDSTAGDSIAGDSTRVVKYVFLKSTAKNTIRIF